MPVICVWGRRRASWSRNMHSIPARSADRDAKAASPKAMYSISWQVSVRIQPAWTANRLRAKAPSTGTGAVSRVEHRVTMTRLRARIAERLVEAQRTAAMLTTFNEVDMSAVMGLRTRYRDAFEKRHDIKLGFMSFFVKAVIEALRRFPLLNASIDGDEIVYHEYFDIGIAVSTDRGLLVPILRNAEQMSVAQIEQSVTDFAVRGRNGEITMDELTGGTFTITNGGIFGSLMSTPILNPPQSGILGMHKIQERAVVVDGEIVVRPMMYLALELRPSHRRRSRGRAVPRRHQGTA
jgi:2-oxoglutarate dehydrogenase E2 component (dihydrolipoamide succinyltransferase)